MYENASKIVLARGKFELTNQDSAGGKKSSVLTSSKQVRKGFEITGNGNDFKNNTSLQKVKTVNHFVSLSFYFGAKTGSPALGMVTRSLFVEYRQVG